MNKPLQAIKDLSEMGFSFNQRKAINRIMKQDRGFFNLGGVTFYHKDNFDWDLTNMVLINNYYIRKVNI